MNVLYIHTHDTGRYIQPYGYAVPTPYLMGLAQDGVIFRQAFCMAPTCSPSRASLLTGMAPHSCGMLGLAHRGFQMKDYSRHLVQFLNQNGYETVLCGIQHEAPQPEMIGYQKILHDPQFHMGNLKAETVAFDIPNALKVAEYIKQSPHNRPFFLSFGMFNTHRLFPDPGREVNPDYLMPPFPLYDCPQNRSDMAGYIASAKIADQCVGIVLEALEASGLEEDTVIIFTTDHGLAFPKMKCHLYDTGIGVALIIKYPGNQRKGQAVEALVSQIDLFPTLCELLKLEKPDWLQGRSLLPVLEGRQDRIREEIMAEVTFHAAYEPMRCIRTDRYKLIQFFEESGTPLPANTDDGLAKSFLIDGGYLQQTREKEQLFDLYLDPVERENRIHDSNYRDIYLSLKTRLTNWMVETSDPLVTGAVEQPKGARVNKPECLSASEKSFI